MPAHKEDEFYVGYAPKAPAGMAAWLKKRIAILLFGALLVTGILVASQKHVSPSAFEFEAYREFEGTIIEKPYPMLRLDRPGLAEAVPGKSRYFLAVFGKKGADEAVAGLDGKRVRVEAALIYRDDQVMLELKEGAVEVKGNGDANIVEEDLGTVTLTGEIVDSKCFLGVMNPGDLKTHKTCAIRCIAGGIPPVLLVRDTTGNAHYFLLVSESGRTVNAEVLDMVAEPQSQKLQP